jgi:hypothetical protein
MADTYPHAQQRAQLESFLKSIGARPSTLRKDACGDPAIMGTKGHVMAASFVSWVKPVRPGKQSSTASAGSMLYVVTESAMAWTYAKRALRFAVVTQDGDEEGILWLDRLPTVEEAKAIRRYLGIPKKAEMSEETRAKRVAALALARETLKAAA